MNYRYFTIFVVALFCICSCKNHNKQERMEHCHKKDLIIEVPVLQIQDMEFANILDKIIQYKEKKMLLSQKAKEIFTVIEIDTNYFEGYTQIIIETVPDLSLVFFADAPKGVISIGEYDFFYFDKNNLVPGLVSSTDALKKYEYKDDGIYAIQEFDIWAFSVIDKKIIFESFCEKEEIYKDVFYSIYSSGKR